MITKRKINLSNANDSIIQDDKEEKKNGAERTRY